MNEVLIVYDEMMELHESHRRHPERAARTQAIWKRLTETGLVQRCRKVNSKIAAIEELKLVHSEEHIQRVLSTTGKLKGGESGEENGIELPSELMLNTSTYCNAFTAKASCIAVGCCLQIVTEIMNSSSIRNGFAIVRPPGHHASKDKAMGFCLFNNIAITAKYSQQFLHAKKVFILDFDVHHGNGTQEIFEDDDSVLYLSIHRHDSINPHFYPGTGSINDIGSGKGKGTKINVSWPGFGFGDAEYRCAFEQIVIPVLKEFNPDLILVSAGFDATIGDPLGKMNVKPETFNWMTNQLVEVNTKMLFILEGGYEVEPLSDGVEQCLRALLGESNAKTSTITELPNDDCLKLIEQIKIIQSPFWNCFKTK